MLKKILSFSKKPKKKSYVITAKRNYAWIILIILIICIVTLSCLGTLFFLRKSINKTLVNTWKKIKKSKPYKGMTFQGQNGTDFQEEKHLEKKKKDFKDEKLGKNSFASTTLPYYSYATFDNSTQRSNLLDTSKMFEQQIMPLPESEKPSVTATFKLIGITKKYSSKSEENKLKNIGEKIVHLDVKDNSIYENIPSNQLPSKVYSLPNASNKNFNSRMKLLENSSDWKTEQDVNPKKKKSLIAPSVATHTSMINDHPKSELSSVATHVPITTKDFSKTRLSPVERHLPSMANDSKQIYEGIPSRKHSSEHIYEVPVSKYPLEQIPVNKYSSEHIYEEIPASKYSSEFAYDNIPAYKESLKYVNKELSANKHSSEHIYDEIPDYIHSSEHSYEIPAYRHSSPKRKPKKGSKIKSIHKKRKTYLRS